MRLAARHFAEQNAAFCLRRLRSLDQRYGHLLGGRAGIFDHGLRDVLHQAALLLERAALNEIDDDFRHLSLSMSALLPACRTRSSLCAEREIGLPQERARTIGKFPRRHNREHKTKRLVFAIGVLALDFTASAPAHADFSVVRFELGFCRIWWNNGINPIGTGWTRVATAPDFTDAQDAAVKKGKCK